MGRLCWEMPVFTATCRKCDRYFEAFHWLTMRLFRALVVFLVTRLGPRMSAVGPIPWERKHPKHRQCSKSSRRPLTRSNNTVQSGPSRTSVCVTCSRSLRSDGRHRVCDVSVDFGFAPAVIGLRAIGPGRLRHGATPCFGAALRRGSKAILPGIRRNQKRAGADSVQMIL